MVTMRGQLVMEPRYFDCVGCGERVTEPVAGNGFPGILTLTAGKLELNTCQSCGLSILTRLGVPLEEIAAANGVRPQRRKA